MRMHYNRIAGQNLERLAALSDGIFAVAMTLLILDIHVPEIAQAMSGIIQQPLWASGALQPELALWRALIQLGPRLLTYLMSFLTLGIFWVGQQTQLNHFASSDRNLTWIHLGFLIAVVLMPFSTGLLSGNITIRLALVVYWLNIVLLGTLLYLSIRYAKRAGLVKDEIALEMRSAHERRIISAQIVYAIAVLLCVINTYLSVAVIICVQLNYALVPRIRWLERLL
ncbi:DUF1211 domain-containing protein [Ktedonosporobacter rubrisoli]|uniref:DUF1211 domain-containing protein n=1 Tax=Ktedonosporobacter rubrisoli TaxID=2509675 RepID=A0A4V0YYF6_KTERU|nr:TMEM175 family protein [Ktedonosporobacter rubrisoli]QBD76051.1 DUF1211 domain-containing protein [Ktedonosporobacter rubrisoli]